jgi:NO-binding membrane sensor protein with MHYT domain
VVLPFGDVAVADTRVGIGDMAAAFNLSINPSNGANILTGGVVLGLNIA